MKTRTPTATTPAAALSPTVMISAGTLSPTATTAMMSALPPAFSSHRPFPRLQPQLPCPRVLPRLSPYSTASILPGPLTLTTSYYPRSSSGTLLAALGGPTSVPPGGIPLLDAALVVGVPPALQSAGCATSYGILSFPASLSPSYAFLLCFPSLVLFFMQVLTLTLLSIFAILLTLLLIYILNPDKDPLPWRAYCAYPSIYNTHQPPNPAASYPNPNSPPSRALPFPPPNLDQLPPAGIFLGVFSVDSAIERRQWVRSTWASHARSRNGAGDGDAGVGTSRTIVRFVLAQPRGDWERRIQLEQQCKSSLSYMLVSVDDQMHQYIMILSFCQCGRT